MTMTLEELRESLDVGVLPNTDRPRWFVAIDAAIRERDELRDRLDSALGDRIREFRRANDELRRAERAESELAIAQNTINAQQDMMGALKRKLALAEGELAALKARIAGGWLCGVSNDACPGNFDAAIYCLPRRFRGKRVRLVVEE